MAESSLNARELSEHEAAYLAGIFDGEGSICVWMNCKRYDNMNVTVSIGMNDRQAIDLFRAAFGGSITIIKRANPRHRNSLRWSVKCRKAKPVLERLLPYLLIKKQQALLALDLLSTVTHIGGRVTPDSRAQQKTLREAIRKLNACGPATPSPDPQISR